MDGCVDLLKFLRAEANQQIAQAVLGDSRDSVQANDAVARHAILGSQEYFRGDVANTGGNWRHDDQGTDGISLVTR